METTNFSFLKKYEPLFFQLATTAEKAFSADPNTTLLKLRQLGEALAQDVTCRVGLNVGKHSRAPHLHTIFPARIDRL